MDPTLAALLILVLGLIAALCWMTWLYLLQYKRTRLLETDNYRLMRMYGRQWGVSMGTPNEFPVADPDPSPVPAFFRMKRPTKPAIRAGSKEL